MKKILFMIHDLGQGGAEKVLVNLVNNLDPKQFDITVMTIVGGGVNEQFLLPHIRYQPVFKKAFPGNSQVLKLFSPETLHRWFVKEHYDIEVAYLEGVAARIISGCTNENTKLVSWIHCTMKSEEEISIGFRGIDEVKRCFNKMDHMVFVSSFVQKAFLQYCPYDKPKSVLPNVNESKAIVKQAKEKMDTELDQHKLHMAYVGKVVTSKGIDRLLRIVCKLCYENYPVHLHVLGNGPQEEEMMAYTKENDIEDRVTFHGYQTNPYKYVANCDLFVCASHAEGFSTAATEALIVGTPVCTVEVSGMKEMLGENNEYGVVVENDEDALYEGIKQFFEDPALLPYYKEQAIKCGRAFSTKKTVRAVEKMLLGL